MTPFEPFERSPVVAVATSGGPDSLALALLAEAWARGRGGRAVALTVDHGLRADSAREARLVGTWLAAAGIEHVALPWRGEKPTTGVQAAARAARYGLLESWCRGAGVLHLLVGHQQEDQAETYLLRRRHRSAPLGLAAMAPVVERRDVRVLRPLLRVPRARLVAALAARRQPWIDDPSNDDPRFERVALRLAMRALARRGWPAGRLASEAGRHASRRRSVEADLTDRLGAAVTADGAGFCRIDRTAWDDADAELRALALGRVLTMVGGLRYAPASEACARLAAALATGTGARTLGGCVVLAWRGAWIVAREDRATRSAVALTGAPVLWDGRFLIEPGPAFPVHLGLTARRLGADGLRRVRQERPGPARAPWPNAVLRSLPGLWRLDDVVAVPHLRINLLRTETLEDLRLRFRPGQPLFAPHLDPVLPGNRSSWPVVRPVGRAKITATSAR